MQSRTEDYMIRIFVCMTQFAGVAVGSGWQAPGAYVNVGSYYIVGVPAGILLGWIFSLGVLVRSIQVVLNTTA